MEESKINKNESTLDARRIIYEKGYPLYRLKRREYCPQMNLMKTFDTQEPRCEDFMKDVEKNKWTKELADAFFMILLDVERFAKINNYTNCQIAALLEIFYSCFQYFVMLPALQKDRFLEYFRETLLLYLVNDPPESLRIFNGIEGFDIAKLFHELVANNFEMMKYVLIPVYVIEIDIEISQ